jgi:hypothetical protein
VAFRLAAVDIQAFIKLILGVFLWDKVAVVWNWLLTYNSTEIKNMWAYTSTPPYF